RLETIATEYKSAYLFVVEASRFEILTTIIRDCLCDNQSAEQDREKVRELLQKYSSAAKDQIRDSALTSGLSSGTVKVATLKSLLEHIRAIDITGQMLH